MVEAISPLNSCKACVGLPTEQVCSIYFLYAVRPFWGKLQTAHYLHVYASETCPVNDCISSQDHFSFMLDRLAPNPCHAQP